MILTPVPVGLILCDYVLVEEGSKKVSIIGSFRDVNVERFPAVLPPFFVYAELTDGLGSGIMEFGLSSTTPATCVLERCFPMTTSESANNPAPEQPSGGEVFTHDLYSIDLFQDVVGDTTVRPLRPEIRQQIRPKPELVLQSLRKKPKAHEMTRRASGPR
jgi:hypothetical protein